MTKRKYVVFNNDVAPVHPGVYQREFQVWPSCKQKWSWARFNGNQWYCADKSFQMAKLTSDVSGYQVGDISAFSSLRWRGLVEKPE